MTNELGRLAQGVGKIGHKKVEGTNTTFFITCRKILKEAKIANANFVCEIKTQKAESHITRLTVGGNILDYYADPSIPTVGILDTKIHLNSAISDAKHGARFCAADIKNYYLKDPLLQYQYMRIHYKYVTSEF